MGDPTHHRICCFLPPHAAFAHEASAAAPTTWSSIPPWPYAMRKYPLSPQYGFHEFATLGGGAWAWARAWEWEWA